MVVEGGRISFQGKAKGQRVCGGPEEVQESRSEGAYEGRGDEKEKVEIGGGRRRQR
jgi:hypothetical protein